MLQVQFFGQHFHFAISLFTALVFFAVFWLYFDAWASKPNKSLRGTPAWLGFLLVSVSFVVEATIIEQSALGKPLLSPSTFTVAVMLRAAGLLVIILGQVINPLTKKPITKGIELDDKDPKKSKAPSLFASSSFGLVFLLPILSLAIAALYWRRATKGLERHLKPVAWAFFCLGIFELLSLSHLLRSTSNPSLANLTAPFGPIWIAEQIVLLLGILVLGRWVWRYLLERFQAQLFMIFTASTLVIFLLTVVSFTFLLMKNIQNQALDSLGIAANVLNYAIDAEKAVTTANAEAIAQNPVVAGALATKDHNALVSATSTFLESKKRSSLMLVNNSGQVLLRAEDPDRWADSLSSDTLIRQALAGVSSSSIDSRDDVLAPVVHIKSAAPVRDANQNIVGAVVVSLAINSAFVDGIKSSTSLDSAVYSDNVRSATTFIAPDNKSRWVGVKETSATVRDTVLKNGQTFKGTLSVLNRPFLAVYLPLKDIDNRVIGMLFVGQPQTNLLRSAADSIELTFIVAAILLVISIIPAYFIAKYLAYQLH